MSDSCTCGRRCERRGGSPASADLTSSCHTLSTDTTVGRCGVNVCVTVAVSQERSVARRRCTVEASDRCAGTCAGHIPDASLAFCHISRSCKSAHSDASACVPVGRDAAKTASDSTGICTDARQNAPALDRRQFPILEPLSQTRCY